MARPAVPVVAAMLLLGVVCLSQLGLAHENYDCIVCSLRGTSWTSVYNTGYLTPFREVLTLVSERTFRHEVYKVPEFGGVFTNLTMIGTYWNRAVSYGGSTEC